ncbi:LysR family transcriptional regulator [Roseomonas terrae]|jgi:DNA-binding transcriptional LysR family regulator|uniref:LysR family transcriptional regulator n=1 Tax=Neoroseomonas terrae TaxID=424799 RepID=A0ABS5EQ90_9PROT|nr:LysR substrate-binding domain-containing protein [Neoroseomonas terrae]MBR0653196.1 LysR family transcriptional regulator [Neoroseomonas terrae]
MNLTQLRSAREVALQDFNLGRAARRLNASQPGITRHIQLLEADLGVAIFARSGRRLTGLTPAGRALMPLAERMLDTHHQMQGVARDYATGASGEITVATMHAHARYILPGPIANFVQDFPLVRLRLRQGSRADVIRWLSCGEADFSLSSVPEGAFSDLQFHHCYDVHRVVLTPKGHPLTNCKRLTLEDLVQYPIITYDHLLQVWEVAGHELERRGLRPNFVLSAVDADIMKTYVRSGLGIGIISNIAYDSEMDADLEALDARHLFWTAPVQVGVRRHDKLSPHALHLVGLFAPAVQRALQLGGRSLTT